jgi:hypothetical protein
VRAVNREIGIDYDRFGSIRSVPRDITAYSGVVLVGDQRTVIRNSGSLNFLIQSSNQSEIPIGFLFTYGGKGITRADLNRLDFEIETLRPRIKGARGRNRPIKDVCAELAECLELDYSRVS